MSTWPSNISGTWNPVIGCRHGCTRCNAKRMAMHWSGQRDLNYYMAQEERCAPDGIHVLDKPLFDAVDQTEVPFPYGFSPTFCRHRLEQPLQHKDPGTYMVCTMGDLWGDWIPQAWIEEVLAAAGRAPWHCYYFLSRNPGRYKTTSARAPNFFYGASVLSNGDLRTVHRSGSQVCFLSIEPSHKYLSLRSYLRSYSGCIGWVVVGRNCGDPKEPYRREWVYRILDACAEFAIPVYMKEDMRLAMGALFTQAVPSWLQAEKIHTVEEVR